jgi:HAMP domain-containing protein
MKKKPTSLPSAVPVGFADDQTTTNGSSRKKQSKKINGNTDNHVSSTDDLDERELLKVLSEVRLGNFSVRMPIDKVGMSGKICDTLNEIISLNEALVEELTLARNTIGKQGHLNHRVELPRSARGSWATSVSAINTLISDLVHPTIEIAHVISSVAKGNLSQEMPLKIGEHVLQGEFAKIAAEVNDMVDQLNSFSIRGNACGARSRYGRKTWRTGAGKRRGRCMERLTDSVNQMASNLTGQVRNIAEVTTAVAKGDLS